MRSTPRRISSRRRIRVRAFMAAVVAALAIAASLFGGLVPKTASGAPPPGRTLGGYTAKGWPVVVEVSRNGKRMERAVAGLDSPCTGGGTVTVPSKWSELPIRGRRFKGVSGDADTEGGLLYEFTGSITGALSRKRTRISGVWSERLVVRNASGATVDMCDSGRVRFTVRR